MNLRRLAVVLSALAVLTIASGVRVVEDGVPVPRVARGASPTLLWAPLPPPESNLTPPSGECLEGVCKDGEGKFQWGSGDVYEGAWDREMRPHGVGKYVWHDGESYDGDWDHGLKHGEGVYTYKNGAMYSGKWKNDFQWGPDNNYALSTGQEFMIDIPEGFPPGSDTADRPPE